MLYNSEWSIAARFELLVPIRTKALGRQLDFFANTVGRGDMSVFVSGRLYSRLSLLKSLDSVVVNKL